MTADFKVVFRKSSGNLHVYLNGNFSGMCAWELIKTIKKQYSGSGRVFINTDGLDRVLPSGIELFKEHMTKKIMPMDGLFIKGEIGFKIGPNGSRVLIRKKQNKRREWSRDIKNIK